MKIMELHFDEQAEGEQYTIKTVRGVSKLQAAAHMFRAAAEGLNEIQEALLPVIEKEAPAD